MRRRRPEIRSNLVDRVVGFFAPGRALGMVRDRAMLASLTGQGGYHGGKRDRRQTQNWTPQGGSANADLLPELADIRARSRDLARNVPIATGAIATRKTHVVGEGVSLNAQVDRDALGISEEAAAQANKAAEREWAIFCREADFSLVQHFADMQAMVYGGVLESGDIFAIRRYREDYAGQPYLLKVQVVEADRVSNPGRTSDTDTLVAGVEHTADGVPVAVHVSDRHPGELRGKALTWQRVPMRFHDGRRVVLHLFERVRPGQTRGIPYMAPVIEALKSLGDYTSAEVQAAVISAMFTVFVTNGADADEGPIPTTETGRGDKPEVHLGAGAIIDLDKGEDVQFANPMRPNPQFDAFVKAFLRQIGVALELPFELLIKHFTASYSASRAALEMAYHSFRRNRGWLVRELLEPVYDWFTEEAVLSGRLNCPGFFDDPLLRRAWLGATWTGPVRMSLDPKKDAEADALDVESGFKTSQQVMTERTGGDFDQKTEQLGREKKAREKAGLGAPKPKPADPGAPPEDDPDKQTDGGEGDDQ